MFDELLFKEKEARDNLEILKCPQGLRIEFEKELNQQKVAFQLYHALLQNQEQLHSLLHKEVVELGILTESWKPKLLKSILAGEITNKELLEHKERVKTLTLSVETYREMESFLEKELQKTKEDMFKVNKTHSEIRNRLFLQEQHEDAGYKVTQDGIFL